MKKKLIVAGIVLFFAGTGFMAACSKSNDMNNNGGITADAIISMKNAVYSPADITLYRGAKIVWVNDDNMVHTVTATDSSFNSGDINPAGTYTLVLDSLGM